MVEVYCWSLFHTLELCKSTSTAVSQMKTSVADNAQIKTLALLLPQNCTQEKIKLLNISILSSHLLYSKNVILAL